MATVKVKFRPSSVKGKEGVLYYQVIHNRVVRQINTGCKLYSSEWNESTSSVLVPSNAKDLRCEYLNSLKKQLDRGFCLLERIITQLEQSGEGYVSDKIVELYVETLEHHGFISYTQNLIIHLKKVGKFCTAENYLTTLNSFIRFRGIHGDVLFDEIDANLMMAYENYLKSEKICLNTSSYYMRNFRAIYNRAVNSGLTVQRNPFKYVYTGIDQTVKRAVTLKVIRQIRDLKLDLDPLMDYARDLFMFSFYTRGMSFIDMAYLKKKDLQNGILSYRRQKTNQLLFIKWEKPMQEIVNKYDKIETPYLLPIIQNREIDERTQYKSALHLTNCKLKRIGEKLRLPIPLTTYVARHGWASIAKSKNIPISIISEAMGHDSENTTRIYLASLDTSIVDKANSLILRSL